MTSSLGMCVAPFFALAIVACGPPGLSGTGGTGGTSATRGTSDAGTTPPGPTENLAHQFTIVTSLGTIKIVLDPDNAPITTANFEQYADDGFYDGEDGDGATVFHRVISDFMIQAGGITESGTQKNTRSSIAIESDNGLANERGTLAMARTNDPNSATSQFFINHMNNDFLNYVDANNPGYAVFGAVIEGLEVVDAIAAVETDGNDEPLTPVVILTVSRTPAR
jgi:cyclophilin family peptidyl-prolyl cis-trans isomerase